MLSILYFNPFRPRNKVALPHFFGDMCLSNPSLRKVLRAKQSGFATFVCACAFPNEREENMARALNHFYLLGKHTMLCLNSIFIPIYFYRKSRTFLTNKKAPASGRINPAQCTSTISSISCRL